MYDRIDTAIDEVLAKPEQEQTNKWWYGKGVEDTKYFLTREPLSDEEIGKLCKDHFKVANLTSFVRAIEKAHGITGVDDE